MWARRHVGELLRGLVDVRGCIKALTRRRLDLSMLGRRGTSTR